MRIIGFNLTKIMAKKEPGLKINNLALGTNIEFADIVKEKSDITKGEFETLKVSFDFSIPYNEKDKKDSKKAEVALSGFMLLLTTLKESEEILKAWKKKELPASFRVPLFNFILKRCSTRALQLEEELSLPLHLPMPQLSVEKKEEKK